MSEHSTQSSAALAAIVDIAADAIILLDATHRIIRFNRGAEQMFGWTEQEMLGQPLDPLLPEAARGVHAGHIRNFSGSDVAARRMAERRAISGRRRSGEEFPAEASIAHATLDGAMTFMVTLRDASDRRRQEAGQQLLATAGWMLASSLDVESRVATVAELPVPLLADWSLLDLVTTEGQVRRMAAVHAESARQAEAATMVRRTPMAAPATIAACHTVQVVHESHAQRVTDPAEWIAANAPDAATRATMTSLGVGAVLMVPLRAGGRSIGVLHLIRQRERGPYRAEEAALADQYARLAAFALDNARFYQEARQAVKERDDMLAIVSHDLRNPVNAVVLLTGAALIRSDADGALLDRDDVESIRAAARQANGLIQDLQDVTRISAGRFRIDPHPVDLPAVVAEVATVFEPVCADAGLTLVRALADPGRPVEVDRDRIVQVLSNLLGNAVRFTPHGGTITLSLQVHETHVEVLVDDTGPGVAPEDMPRLFERYWQAPRLLRAGSGLGLSIAKGIVEAHGGAIGVRSAPGAGSTFWVTLPYAVTA